MSSSSNKRQTMAKLQRERARKEKRQLKQERKDARKLAAAEGREWPEVEPGDDGAEPADADADAR